MKKAIIILLFSLILCKANAQSFSFNENFVVEKTPRREYKLAGSLSGKVVDSVNVKIQYFDGLGRPLQVVDWQGSPTKRDIVQHTEYDGFGREAKKYLSYAEQTSNNGSFKSSAGINQGNFYKVGGGWDASVKKTGHPFSVTVFENSPLNRVLEQGSPGSIWQPIANRGTATTTGRTVVSEYGTNVVTTLEGVKLWKVNYTNNKLAGASSVANYAAGKLYKLTIKDENWVSSYGKGGTVDEYKDFEGNVVLKRVWESNTKVLNTYYVYDDFGNLCYVLPPAVTSSSFTEKSTDSFFDKYIYGYHYDGRQRLIEKKIPGKGWEWLVYNKNDQEVLRQDSLQRVTKTWTYTKYDAFGRVAYSGLYTNATLTTQTLAQTAVNNVTYLWEDRLETLNYTDRAFPIIGSTAPHIVNYYDDYTFNGATTSNLQAVGITKSLRTKSFLTGSRITNVDGLGALLTINYYDDKGRLIQTASQNQLGGTDYVTNTYNFSNELVSSKRDHKPSATGTVTTILTSNTYDHAGRLKQTRKKINTQAEIIQSNLAYNEIGQLKQKDLHASGSTAVQQITYSYNERGWLTSINSPTAISAIKRFGMTLNYGDRERSYNGNIGSIQWNTLVSTGGTQVPVQSYTYSYDNLNRLKKAAYSSTGKVNYFNEELAYDVMGNIDSLRRSKDTTVWFNNFKYTYQGNQLTGISDAGSASRNNSFTYDGNGNGIKNTRLGITQIQYNYLNLPKKFVKGSENLQYTYDATGTKLTKTWGTNVTQYIDGIQYKNGVIEFIQTEEGRIIPNGSSFTYEYFLKDHLGNTRAVVDHTGAVKQIQDYYAFGMEMNPGNGLTASTNNYKYNGKEKQVELSLDQLDYGARFYDAEIGRWNVVDPLADKFDNVSPYNYALNNPVLMLDPDGMEADSAKIKMPTIKLAEVLIMINTQRVNLSTFGRLLVAGAAADLATPEASDAYVPKLVAEGIIVGIYLGYEASKNYFDYSKKTDKEKATDVPSWARGQKPKSGENGKQFAKRLMDEKYGVGKWSDTGPGSEYSKIKKSGDRNRN